MTKLSRVKTVSTLAIFGLMLTALPVAANTITYAYTTLAGDSGPGAGITYTLAINDVTGASTFDVTGSAVAAEVWTAGWFTFKFNGSTTLDIDNLTYPASTGPWSVADSESGNVNVLKAGGGYSPILVGGSAGFYVTSLAEGGAADNTSQGVCLTAAHCASDLPSHFAFTLASPFSLADEIPLQVSYYDGLTGSGAVLVNQLSKVLEEEGPPPPPKSVPDGGLTIGLLGAALVTVEILRRSNQA